jgi:NAD+ diphosphatase
MALPRSHPNVLAGPYLERAAHWRKDEERLRAALADPTTLFVPVWRARNAVEVSQERACAHFVTGVDSLVGIDTSGCILLGEFRERVCFAVAVAE